MGASLHASLPFTRLTGTFAHPAGTFANPLDLDLARSCKNVLFSSQEPRYALSEQQD